MDNIIIRTAMPSDAEAIQAIYAPYVAHTAITFEYQVPSVEEMRSRIETTLKKYPYFVAVEGSKIVGYAYVGPFKERAAYDWAVETSIYVDRNHRRNGMGRILYEALEDICRKMNLTNMNACITCPKEGHEDPHVSKDSIHFHQTLGYRLVGRFHDIGYKFDSWYDMGWMEKMIGEHDKNMADVIPFPDLDE